MPDWNTLLFGQKASTIPGAETLTPAFRTKVDQVAERLKVDPQHLLAVMRFETGGTFSPSVRNQAGSGATGLIQFMPQTARRLGTSTDALARMSAEQQLDYVEQYLRPYRGRLGSLQDTYMAVLSPAAIGKPASHVLFQQGTRAYAQNKGLDRGQTGRVTVGDAVAAVEREAPAGASRLQAAGAGPVDWNARLFGPAAAPQTDWRTVLSAPPPDPGQKAARAWGQELFGTPPSAPGAAQQPGAVDWAQELFT